MRSTDLDLLGHVNNAVYWQVVEDELGRRSADRRVAVAELEHRVALGADDRPEVASALAGDALSVWLTTAGGVRAAANVRLTGSARHRGGRATSPGETG